MDEQSKLSNPYYNIELSTTILLEAKQLNNNLYINLKENLIKKVKDKCNKYGYVSHIYKIIKYSDGILHPEDFSGNVRFNVDYIAKLCNPIEDTLIVCKIDAINKILIKALCGPIIIIIKKNDFNDKIFKINNSRDLLYKENILKKNDFVTVKIIAKKLSYNDTRICSIGYLDKIPTQKEIDKYYNEPNSNTFDNEEPLNLSYKETSDTT